MTNGVYAKKLDRPLFFAGKWRPLHPSTGLWYVEDEGYPEQWVTAAELDRWLNGEEIR